MQTGHQTGGTRGEFNRTFDVAAVREHEGTVTFVCPTVQQYVLLLRRGKTQVIDGEVIKTEDLSAEFRDFTFRTSDPEKIELIRKHDAFQRGIVKEVTTVKRETSEAQVASIVQQLQTNPELAKAVVAQLRPGKTSAPEVKDSK